MHRAAVGEGWVEQTPLSLRGRVPEGFQGPAGLRFKCAETGEAQCMGLVA